MNNYPSWPIFWGQLTKRGYKLNDMERQGGQRAPVDEYDKLGLNLFFSYELIVNDLEQWENDS